MTRTERTNAVGLLVLMVGCLLIPSASALARTHALLIGVWEYQEKALRLDAPPNDLELMKRVLAARGVTGKNIHVLANPTKADIQQNFEELSEKLASSDDFLFYFSGHGTQIIDKFGAAPGDEAKGRYPDRDDEALLPADARLASPETYLLDDELNVLLQGLNTYNVTCIIDTCYSGDILRMMRLGKPKGAVSLSPTVDIVVRPPTPNRTEDILDDAADFALLIAAAPHNQVVHELRLPVGRSYVPASALTYSLYRQAIRVSTMSYRQLAQRVQNDHQLWDLPWAPVVEGPTERLDQAFLGELTSDWYEDTVELRDLKGRTKQFRMEQLVSAGGDDMHLGPLHSPDVRRWALVIGVDTYPTPYQSLKYAADDAKAMRDVLQDAGFMVTLMTPDGLLQPTKENIVRQLEWFAEIEDIELLTIYLSGHGEDEDGTGYFLPMDVSEPLVDSGLSLESLFGMLEQTDAQNRFVIVDACRVAPKHQFVTDLSRYSEESDIIFTACDRNQWAPEVPLLKHGLFTYFLLKGLSLEDGKAGAAARDGTVTVLGLLDYVQRGIEDWYAQVVVEQRPPQQITPRVFYNGRTISLHDSREMDTTFMARARETIAGMAVSQPMGYNETYMPITFSFLPGIGSGSWGAPNVTTNLSFNILAGRYARLDGVEFGGIANIETASMRGLQYAGVANLVGGPVDGYQGAGVLNVAEGRLAGLQTSGAANYVGGKAEAGQFVGGVNVVEGEFTGIQAAGGVNVVGDLRGNLLDVPHAPRTRAAQFAGGLNLAAGDAEGAQMAGGVNITGGELTGVQMAGGVNYVGTSSTAGQFAGGANVAISELKGVQMAGGVNYIGGIAEAWQVAGGVNVAPFGINGSQIAGGVNFARGLRGAQVGTVNVSAGDVEGTQIGIINVAGKTRGAQIGLINYADDMEGVPFGLLSFVRNGRFNVDLWGNEVFAANLGIKTGTKYFYSILTAGVHAEDIGDELYRWGYGLGFGGQIPLGSGFLGIEALHYKLNEDEIWNDDLHMFSRFQITAGWQIRQRLALYAGASLNVFVSQLNDGSHLGLESVYDTREGDTWVRMWPGFTVGIQF